MNAIIIILARYASTRFPGKPLHPIKGRSMIERTWNIATAVKGVGQVCVATDDSRIAEHVAAFGGDTVLTSPECRSDAERVLEAARTIKQRPNLILTLTCDGVLTPPWVIQAIVDEMRAEPTISMATAAVPIDLREYQKLRALTDSGRSGCTTVSFDARYSALYFSKALIPAVRLNGTQGPNFPMYRHIGVYGYTFLGLERYVALRPGQLEQVEQLEQLRALENGIPIRVVIVDCKGRSQWEIEDEEDVAEVEAIIEAEGELVDGPTPKASARHDTVVPPVPPEKKQDTLQKIRARSVRPKK